MGRRTSKSDNDTQDRVERSLKGDQQTAVDKSESQLQMLAYQAILARELLINDSNEQDPKYF